MIIYKLYSLYQYLLLLVVVLCLTLSYIVSLSSTTSSSSSSSSIMMRIITLSPLLKTSFISCYLYQCNKKNIWRYRSNFILKCSTHDNEDNINKRQQRSSSSSSSSNQHNNDDDADVADDAEDEDDDDEDITINGYKYKTINNNNNNNSNSNQNSINWDPYMAPKLDFDECYYDVLEAKQFYDSKELKKAYYKIVFKYHPDNKINDIDKELCNKQMMVSYFNSYIHIYIYIICYNPHIICLDLLIAHHSTSLYMLSSLIDVIKS